MNCWGFTPEIISCIQSEFAKFLSKSSNPLKDELYLTDVIDFMIKNDACDVTVYNTSAQWLGVTYQEDKPAVVAGIKKLINNGVYPENIWS